MRAFLRKLWTLLAVQYAYMLEYRAEILLWAIATILPLLMMGPWMVAGASGRFPLSEAAFARYFVAAFIVRQFSIVWVIWEFEYQVVSGRLSPLLLHPIDPIWRFVSSHLGEHLTRAPIVAAFAVVAVLLFPQAIHDEAGTIALPALLDVAKAFVAIYAAFAIRFLLQYSVALGAFWVERVSAFDNLIMIPYLFLSGLVAPLEVFPPAVREFALWTPFPYLVWFPARLLAGGEVDLGRAVLVIAGWIAVLHVVVRIVWRRGLRHYSAMGA